MKGSSSSTSGGGGGGGRSASDKEKTKMRERQRRGITTKIFNGLRKHGGYNLPPRADINDVLRELAKEAGWVIEPDGTTYRSSSTTAATTTSPSISTFYHHQLHGAANTGRRSGTPTPTSSFSGVGGECSVTASPIHVVASLTTQAHHYQHHHHLQQRPLSSASENDLHLGMCFGMPFYGGGNGTRFSHSSGTVNNSAASSMAKLMMQQQQQLGEVCSNEGEEEGVGEEARASNQNSPIMSPPRSV